MRWRFTININALRWWGTSAVILTHYSVLSLKKARWRCWARSGAMVLTAYLVCPTVLLHAPSSRNRGSPIVSPFISARCPWTRWRAGVIHPHKITRRQRRWWELERIRVVEASLGRRTRVLNSVERILLMPWNLLPVAVWLDSLIRGIEFNESTQLLHGNILCNPSDCI